MKNTVSGYWFACSASPLTVHASSAGLSSVGVRAMLPYLELGPGRVTVRAAVWPELTRLKGANSEASYSGGSGRSGGRQLYLVYGMRRRT